MPFQGTPGDMLSIKVEVFNLHGEAFCPSLPVSCVCIKLLCSRVVVWCAAEWVRAFLTEGYLSNPSLAGRDLIGSAIIPTSLSVGTVTEDAVVMPDLTLNSTGDVIRAVRLPFQSVFVLNGPTIIVCPGVCLRTS